jgi:hypothetical protein
MTEEAAGKSAPKAAKKRVAEEEQAPAAAELAEAAEASSDTVAEGS